MQLRSSLNGLLKPLILNWLWGKLSSSLVSETIRRSSFTFIWSTRKSNLFWSEFIFRCAIMRFFKCLLRREPKMLQFIETSTDFDLFSSPSEEESLSLVSSSQLTWDRALIKLLVKIILLFLFRCYLLLFMCCDKIFFGWLMNYIFRSAHSHSKFSLTWTAFSLNLSFLTTILDMLTSWESFFRLETRFVIDFSIGSCDL